jgi:hypothetical protein
MCLWRAQLQPSREAQVRKRNDTPAGAAGKRKKGARKSARASNDRQREHNKRIEQKNIDQQGERANVRQNTRPQAYR